MKSFWLCLISLAIALSGVLPSFSAEIVLGGDRSLNCVATISGSIDVGDHQKLKSFLSSLEDRSDETINGISLDELQRGYGRARLCLDSPGGSLAEAVGMADLLVKDFGSSYWINSLGTAVPPGAICESACAVFFMAGGEDTESDIGRVADRVLHAKGRLGFHSIALVLPEASYSRDDVGKAFGLALKSVGAVAIRMEALRLRLSLLQTMLATAPDDMYYVETIGDAVHWNIQLAGLPILRQPTPANFFEACLKITWQLTPEDGVTVPFYSYEKQLDGSNRILQHHIWPEREISRVNFESYGESDDGEISFLTDRGTELGDMGCDGAFDSATGELYASTLASNGWNLEYPNEFLFPGGLTFRDILEVSPGTDEISPALVVARKEEGPFDTTCLVFKGDIKTDEEPCRRSVVAALTAGMNSYIKESYQWPSGGNTVVERQDGQVIINGSAAEEFRRSTNPAPVAYDTSVNCLKNTNSGNTFCYLSDD